MQGEIKTDPAWTWNPMLARCQCIWASLRHRDRSSWGHLSWSADSHAGRRVSGGPWGGAIHCGGAREVRTEHLWCEAIPPSWSRPNNRNEGLVSRSSRRRFLLSLEPLDNLSELPPDCLCDRKWLQSQWSVRSTRWYFDPSGATAGLEEEEGPAPCARICSPQL